MKKNNYKFGLGNQVKNIDLDSLLSEDSVQFLIDESDKEIFKYEPTSKAQAKMIHESVKMKSKSQAESENQIQPINEETYKQLRDKSDKARRERAKHLSGCYVGIDPKRGWLIFNVNSQYTRGKKYTQYVSLKDVKDIKYLKDLKSRDIARLLLSGDIGVRCTCPDFRYRYSYMSYKYNYGLLREVRYPKIRNPYLKGRLCKHLILVMMMMQTNLMSIQKDMKKSKYYMRKLNDTDDE